MNHTFDRRSGCRASKACADDTTPSPYPRRSLTLVIVTAIALVGCGGKKAPAVEPPPRVEIVTVKEPVPVRVTPPPELLAAIKPPLPVFVSPLDPDATSALTAEGERLLRGLIEELLQQIAAWKAWATEKE